MPLEVKDQLDEYEQFSQDMDTLITQLGGGIVEQCAGLSPEQKEEAYRILDVSKQRYIATVQQTFDELKNCDPELQEMMFPRERQRILKEVQRTDGFGIVYMELFSYLKSII